MAASLNVLLLEDEPLDAALVERALTAQVPGSTVVHAQTKQQYVDSLTAKRLMWSSPTAASMKGEFGPIARRERARLFISRSRRIQSRRVKDRSAAGDLLRPSFARCPGIRVGKEKRLGRRRWAEGRAAETARLLPCRPFVSASGRFPRSA